MRIIPSRGHPVGLLQPFFSDCSRRRGWRRAPRSFEEEEEKKEEEDEKVGEEEEQEGKEEEEEEKEDEVDWKLTGTRTWCLPR